jgi:hypothetical protein
MNMQPTTTTTPSAQSGKLIPLPPAKVRLATVKEVRLELARLYRETKAGHIDPADAAKLAFILDRLRQCIVDHEIEARVMLLEQLTEEKKS